MTGSATFAIPDFVSAEQIEIENKNATTIHLILIMQFYIGEMERRLQPAYGAAGFSRLVPKIQNWRNSSFLELPPTRVSNLESIFGSFAQFLRPAHGPG